MHKIKILFYLILVSFSYSSYAILGTGLEISVAGDLVYEQGINKDSQAQDKLITRVGEFMFYAPIDHQFDGVLSAAAHDENGETVFELHELYIATSKLIPRSNLKVGQFFLGVGRLNRFHQHDWAFTRAPKVHRTFFAEEGVFDAGVEYNYLIPSSMNMNLTVGVTSGHRYGHSHTAGSKPKSPTHYTRLSSFLPFSTTNGMEFGLNYLGRTDAQDNQMMLAGIDLTGKWKEGKTLNYLLQSELWYKSEKDIDGDITEQVGLYVFNDFATGAQTSVGFRLDAFKDLSKRNSLTGKKINNISYGALLQTTYTSSEFAKIRPTISHEFDREEGATTAKDTRLSLQFIFILGSHPAHEF
ncbi:hypothetical protein M902_0650 [Bacteriovorax sp. BAL6_X]|uniref:hypothetical protein n=1 Tax=Bacteriovorax sp. BAL6_X TaxID=1201290 RepID=UPI000385CE7A|nr:hypothetical protein [Bacteriovorax sp. BAL6_X]EPZ50040.1 hypothetical protein M902_0650 [Bacteriovorax sp. BAL6_X]